MAGPQYPTLKKLRAGEIVNLDGIELKREEGEIREGDLYVAERNTGPKLLTALKVDCENGYILPVDEGVYPFDIHECVRVCEA